MASSKIAIVIPAYNEENTIGEVIEKVSPYGDVIVVNDCSTDNTKNVALSFGAIVVNHEVNKGYDGALNSGFAHADSLGYDQVITFDADGQHSELLLSIFIEKLSHHDLVLGVRPKTARFAEKVFSFCTNLLYGIKDPLCGMKGYNLFLYRELGYFDSINSIGTELALSSVKQKKSFIQLDIPIDERIDEPRFGRIFKANLVILKAMINFLKKYYL